MTTSDFVNPLPGVPSIESPFFDQLFADVAPTTYAIALQLRNQGFAVIEFPESDFEAIAESIKTDLQPRYETDLWQQYREGGNKSLRLQDAWQFNQQVKQLACNPLILALLTRLYGRQAMPFQTLNFPVGTQQHYHTDSIHFSSLPERFMCGVWIALEDITLENGPLIYYPNSHRWPIYTNEHIGKCVGTMKEKPTQVLYQDMWQALVAAYGAKPQQFLAKKGQALIWAANLMHGGSPQLNRDATRWSQVTHYFFENCAYYSPMMSDPFYGQIDFRELVNIGTGESMTHRYAGHPISRNFIAATNPETREWEHAFDPALYLAANPDVAKSGNNPFEHYLRFGRYERRRLRPE